MLTRRLWLAAVLLWLLAPPVFLLADTCTQRIASEGVKGINSGDPDCDKGSLVGAVVGWAAAGAAAAGAATGAAGGKKTASGTQTATSEPPDTTDPNQRCTDMFREYSDLKDGYPDRIQSVVSSFNQRMADFSNTPDGAKLASLDADRTNLSSKIQIFYSGATDAQRLLQLNLVPLLGADVAVNVCKTLVDDGLKLVKLNSLYDYIPSWFTTRVQRAGWSLELRRLKVCQAYARDVQNNVIEFETHSRKFNALTKQRSALLAGVRADAASVNHALTVMHADLATKQMALIDECHLDVSVPDPPDPVEAFPDPLSFWLNQIDTWYNNISGFSQVPHLGGGK